MALKEEIEWPSFEDWWRALRWVLLVFTAVVAVTMAGSFVPYERVIAGGHPWLPRTHCPGCPLCGMTRSFCAMSAGRWDEALRWNRGGPMLYALGWLWLSCAATTAVRLARGYFMWRPAVACAAAGERHRPAAGHVRKLMYPFRRTQSAARRVGHHTFARATAGACLFLALALFVCCGPECPSWDAFPPSASGTESRSPGPATADQLVVYLDTSSSMAGYVSTDRAGQTVFSRTLQELRNFSTIINPPLDVSVRRVDATVGPPQPDSALSEASINPSTYSGAETDLAGAINTFPQPPGRAGAVAQKQQRGSAKQERVAVKPGGDGEGEEAATAPPARFHILVTDGVQSTSRQREGMNCVTGSDQLCVRKKIFDLMNKGWGVYVIGMRSEFSGKLYSEVSKAVVPYASKKRDPESYRPFYLYLFSPDRAALDKMVGTLKERLRPLAAQPDSMRTLALTSAYAGGAAPCDITIPKGDTDALEVTKDSHDVLARFTLLVDPNTEKSGPQPFAITTELPWSADARDSGTPNELAGLVHWDLVSVYPKEGEAAGGGRRVRLPELKVVRQQVGADGKVAIEATAQWPPATGDLECRVYRLVGRLNLEEQTPPWVQRWSTNLDTTAETGNRTLNLESELLGLWHNPDLEKQVIAEIYIRVGPM